MPISFDLLFERLLRDGVAPPPCPPLCGRTDVTTLADLTAEEQVSGAPNAEGAGLVPAGQHGRAGRRHGRGGGSSAAGAAGGPPWSIWRRRRSPWPPEAFWPWSPSWPWPRRSPGRAFPRPICRPGPIRWRRRSCSAPTASWRSGWAGAWPRLRSVSGHGRPGRSSAWSSWRLWARPWRSAPNCRRRPPMARSVGRPRHRGPMPSPAFFNAWLALNLALILLPYIVVTLWRGRASSAGRQHLAQ